MKVLLAFGTKYGSTEKVANRVAEVLRGKGHDVMVADLRKRKKPSTDGYDAVVMGSSIIVGAWTREAQMFIDDNASRLSAMPVAMFVCCGNLLTDPSKEDEYRRLYLEDVASKAGIASPISMALFGGEIDFSKYSFMTKAILSGVGARKAWEKNGADISKPYDFRNWEDIVSWAEDLAGELGLLEGSGQRRPSY